MVHHKDSKQKKMEMTKLATESLLMHLLQAFMNSMDWVLMTLLLSEEPINAVFTLPATASTVCG